MLDIERITPTVITLCQRLHVKRLDLFGSATTEQFGTASDVDVLVECDRQVGDLFNRYFELKEELEMILGRSVNVVVADAIKNPYFRTTVEQTRKRLYAA